MLIQLRGTMIQRRWVPTRTMWETTILRTRMGMAIAPIGAGVGEAEGEEEAGAMAADEVEVGKEEVGKGAERELLGHKSAAGRER